VRGQGQQLGWERLRMRKMRETSDQYRDGGHPAFVATFIDGGETEGLHVPMLLT
jgi:hypothetical protein